MSDGYSGTLKDGREIYIPHWPVDVAVENLTKAGQLFGNEAVVNMATPSLLAVVKSIMEAKDPVDTAAFVKHCICQARMEGEKISNRNVDKLFSHDLAGAAELFAWVLHEQYYDFFKLGLAEVSSPKS